jgi:hypothetical protein
MSRPTNTHPSYDVAADQGISTVGIVRLGSERSR